MEKKWGKSKYFNGKLSDKASLGLRIIQKLLGHKSIATTLIYTHMTNVSTNIVRSVLDNALAQ